MYKVTYRDEDGNDVHQAELHTLPKEGDEIMLNELICEVTHIVSWKIKHDIPTAYIYVQELAFHDQ